MLKGIPEKSMRKKKTRKLNRTWTKAMNRRFMGG